MEYEEEYSMKIMFITKRYYMNKDLLSDKYGRFYEIPLYLEKTGHQLFCRCISYRFYTDEDWRKNGETIWNCYYIGKLIIVGVLKYIYGLSREIKKKKPDVILAASDSFHVIIAWQLAKKHNIPFVVDLYDNFESYKGTMLPGIKSLFKKACREADGISVISNELKDLIVTGYKINKRVVVVENAISEDIFFPREKSVSRQLLALPSDAKLIGTAGALNLERGIDTLYEAFEKLAEKYPNLYLVLAGPTDDKCPILNHPRVRYFGDMQHQDVAILFNALDVGVICNNNDLFGRYCCPQKAYEMLACDLPIVAANIGVMSRLLTGTNASIGLYQPQKVDSLIMALEMQLKTPTTREINIPGWRSQADKISCLINETIC